jgi:hypothetical protein
MEPTPEKAPSRGRSRRAFRVAEAALALLVAFCPLALGSVHLEAMAIGAGLALLALGLSAFACLRSGEPFELPGPGPTFALITLYVAFQLLPLPPAILGALAPRTRELLEFVLGPLGLYPAAFPLSLDPPATARELVKAVTFLCAFLAAAQLCRSERARRRLTVVLAVTTLAVVAIGFGHEVASAETLFGWHAFAVRPAFLTTFGNPNHLAGFLTVGGVALLSIVLSERDRKVATLWAFGVIATGVAVLLTLSRGGFVAFVLAQLLCAALSQAARKGAARDVPLRAAAIFVPVALLLSLGIASYLAWDSMARELATAESVEKVRESKLALWPHFLPLLRAHLLMGVGRGAFEPAFQGFQPGLGAQTVTHPENLVFQWTTELGLPAGALLLVACALAVGTALRRNVSHLEQTACAAGVIAIAFHDVVDFSLEFGAVAVPSAVVFAIAVGGAKARLRLGAGAVLAALPVLAVGTALAAHAAKHSLAADGGDLSAKAGTLSADAFAGEVSRVAARHPSDYFPHLLGAQVYAAERPLRPARVVELANRAMFLNPTQALPHRHAAAALFAIGQRAQAQIEYRLAFRGWEDVDLITEVARSFHTAADLQSAIPDSEVAIIMLMAVLRGQHRFAEALAVGEGATARVGERLGVLEQFSFIARDQNDAARMEQVGKRMSERFPADPLGLFTQAQAFVIKGDRPAAIRLLDAEGVPRHRHHARLGLTLAQLHADTSNARQVRESLKLLPPALDAVTRVESLRLESVSHELEGQTSLAIGSVRAALWVRPSDVGMRLRCASLLESGGRFDEALAELDSLRGEVAAEKPAEQIRERIAARKRELDQMTRLNELVPGPPP